MDIMEQYLEVAADFCQNELLPINATGDQQGCRLQDGVVTTPDGFKAAYDKYVELGFTSLTGDEKYGDYAFNRELHKRGLKRMFLHAWRLRLNHPLSGAPLELLAPLPRELQSFLDTLSA